MILTSKRIIIAMLALVFCCTFTGCNYSITGASPDPSTIIDKAPGESVTLSVSGPDTSFYYATYLAYGWTSYRWTIRYLGSNDGADEVEYPSVTGKELSFTVPSDKATNKIKITCSLIYNVENGEGDFNVLDYRTWTIRTLQETSPTWNGSYYIEDNTDLALLADYTTITGNLEILNSSLTTLAGLENLQTIGGSLCIDSNTALQNLSGLQNITSVGDSIDISFNDTLNDISSLNGITALAGELSLSNNPAITSLTGLENITSIGTTLTLSGMSALESVQTLQNLSYVGTRIRIIGCSALTSLTGLENITSLSGLLWIGSNTLLTNLAGLCNVMSVGTIHCSNNPALTSIDMSALTTVENNFVFENNTSLSTALIEALRDQAVIGATVIITDNMD